MIEFCIIHHFYPHTLTIRLKRPVYRGFSGEGWCEGVRVKMVNYAEFNHNPPSPRFSILRPNLSAYITFEKNSNVFFAIRLLLFD